LLRDKTRPPGKKPLLEATVRQVVTKTTRAGIEAKHGQAVRRCGLRRCRYIGLAKTHLQHLISAAAINLARIANWVNGILALQLQLPFQVGFLGRSLMASAPDRPGDNESRIDAPLDQTPGNTTDLLE
jgi:hypothetical protein